MEDTPLMGSLAEFTSLNWLTFDWWRQQIWLQHIVAAIVTLVAAGVLWFLLSRALTALFKRTDWIQEHLEMLLMRISKWVYWMLAIIFALQQGGVDTDSLWTAVTAAIAMVAVGFVAVWSVLSNLIASVLIFATNLFKLNDDVELMDAPGGNAVRGKVLSVDMMFTIVEETRDDGTRAKVKIPNNLFFQKITRVRG